MSNVWVRVALIWEVSASSVLALQVAVMPAQLLSEL